MESACKYLTAAFAPAFTSYRFEESKSALKVYLETCMHGQVEHDRGGSLMVGFSCMDVRLAFHMLSVLAGSGLGTRIGSRMRESSSISSPI